MGGPGPERTGGTCLGITWAFRTCSSLTAHVSLAPSDGTCAPSVAVG